MKASETVWPPYILKDWIKEQGPYISCYLYYLYLKGFRTGGFYSTDPRDCLYASSEMIEIANRLSEIVNNHYATTLSIKEYHKEISNFIKISWKVP
ncbi:hypothetical protein [Bartonella rattaustraliani]|uniref:hypothetical protein n=1 Tax=Bartonella rattaustraliani TaxID=481139 RepID=UPI0012EA8F90|nr:hypothetical protein [Bartonella rattaustraliani]